MEDVSSGILCLPRVQANLSLLPPIVRLRISLSADRFEGGCLLMVLMRAYNRRCYCLGHSVESKMDIHICIGLVN